LHEWLHKCYHHPMVRLRFFRDKQGLSLRKLAEKAGVHYVSLVRLEAGKFDPRLSTLYKLATALNVRVAQLIGETKPYKGGKHGTH
jgi:transcriptional regulator with XRE-family HTH domain